ncbi:MAG: phosphoglucosamine mutase [Candidatus Saccharibacteria bacterium]|nr:phosphoglucosamine mutase [Candidatus Saccharibacteria bacterium]
MKYFGTDGIRQKADKFTTEFLAKIVRGLVEYAGDEIRVLIGGDTRESSEWILADLELILESFGVDYGNVGVLPTPGINYCFYEMGFDFAIDVTASHNPYMDNGIKILERGDKFGQKLGEAGREAIERSLEREIEFSSVAPTVREGLHDEAVEIYKKHLIGYIGKADFSELKIGVDCANGATAVIGGQIFEELGAKVTLINADFSYGQKINNNCGSTHLEGLRDLVRQEHLDFGIAFDGDGDRCLLVDAKGKEVDGDEIIVILAEYLKLDKVAVTVMANQGIMEWAKDKGVETKITAVGDSNVAEAMRMNRIEIGGEQSGHIILPGEAMGDGMLTGLMVTKVVAEAGSSLAESASKMKKFPQMTINMPAEADQKERLKTSERAKRILLEYNTKAEKANGRILVRPSGTEPVIRITIWGDDEEKIRGLINELKEELARALNEGD